MIVHLFDKHLLCGRLGNCRLVLCPQGIRHVREEIKHVNKQCHSEGIEYRG